MKKGFTLVELIATLVVLSIVAIIVVPNIKKNVSDMKSELYNTQIEAIKSAARNWSNDHISEIPSIDGESVYVFLKDLKGTYIDQKVYKDEAKTEFNDNIFVLITCHVIEADANNNRNYKYEYEIYDTNEKHLAYLAHMYAKKNNVTSRITVTLSNLLPLAHDNLKVGNRLKNIEDGSLIDSASVVIEYNNHQYTYRVNIN